MGCGKSKHDVASENTTVLQRKKSSVTFKEIETKTEDIKSENVENVNLVVEVEQKESAKENDVEENKDIDEVNDVKDEEKIDGEEKNEDDVEGPFDEVKKNDDVTLIENDEKINDVIEDEKNLVQENEKEEANVEGENLTKKEEEVVEDTNVSIVEA